MTEVTENTTLSDVEESVGAELLRALVAEISLLPKAWQNTPEAEQQAIIDRLRQQVQYQVGHAVRRIAASGFPHAIAQVDSLAIKGKVKCVLLIGPGSAMQELTERVGSQAVLVLTDPEQFLGGMYQVRAEADQRDLPMG